ncbi:MAG TPA: hypothetical protein VGM44_14580 [Polyangiaceae bacterium]
MATGCGDDFADPIVRTTDAPGGGIGGGTGVVDGDTGDLCFPCSVRSDCAFDESCIASSRNDDRFCSRTCGDGNGRCPNGYTCSDVFGSNSPACVPEVGDCGGVVY